MSTDLAALDLNLILALHVLLQEQSVSRAAVRLGITPSAMSHRLRRMQEALGDPLLVRAGRAMATTPRAEALRPRVAHAVASARAVFDTERFVPARASGVLRLAATDHISVLLGARMEQRLCEEAPGLDVHTHSVAEQTPDQLRRGAVDLGIGFFHLPPDDLHLQHLFDDGYVCVVRPGHPLLDDPGLSCFVAQRHLLVAPRGGAWGRVDIALERLGLRRRVARLESSFLTAFHIVAQTDMVLTVSWRLAHCIAPPLGLAILPPPLALPNYGLVQVWHARQDNDPRHRWLREVIRDIAATLPEIPSAGERITVLG